MIDLNNPAGRYYEILRQAKEKGDSNTVRQVWADILEENVRDDSAITRKVIEVYQLGQEVRRLIEITEGVNTELYLSSFPQSEAAIFPLNLDASWSSRKNQLNDGVMTRLQFCAELLTSIYSEELLEKEDLDQVIIQIEELFESIQHSALDSGVRITLLEEVERLRAAISMYKIKGAKGLKQSLQSTIGMVVANQTELSNVAKTAPDVIDRLGNVIDKVDSFTAKAMKVQKALTKPVRFLIELASGDEKNQPTDIEATDEVEA